MVNVPGWTFPQALSPGDCVAVVAPASPFPRAEFWRGLGWIRARYRIHARTSILAREGYLAGDDALRARALGEAMCDPDVKAIIAARGGYGAMRIVDALPWDAFAAAPKWIVGFSDVTALHVEAAARRIASIHGPNVTGLGRDATPWMRARWLAALERPAAPQHWCNLHVIRPGTASGPLVGGNLALLEAMAAAGRLQIPEGAILVLEDVTERPYRIDRMLTALRLGGHLARVAAIVLGDFDQCDPGPDGTIAADVLRDRTRDLGIPIVSGAPFGHAARNDAFILGAVATIGDGTLAINPPERGKAGSENKP